MNILIRGDGVAARCCAHLLMRSGFEVALEPTRRSTVPAVMLSDASVDLMRGVFAQPLLFSSARRIRRRVSKWGNETVTVPHAAVVVSEEELLDELGVSVPASLNAPPDFVIYAAQPLPAGVSEARFGSRFASTAAVKLICERAEPCCWMEATLSGWLFLIADGGQSAWMLAVGNSVDVLLGESCVVAKEVSAVVQTGPQFRACPRVVDPLAGEGWLACGSAAMAFDPICGDGTANAIREAVLAAAVVRAIGKGADGRELLRHYRHRLLGGFLRHLAFCEPFYRAPHQTGWWSEESQAIRAGIEWSNERLHRQPPFRFRLDGFDLRPVEAA